MERHSLLKLCAVGIPFCAFAILLALWTWKLLQPYPVPESVAQELTEDDSFVLAKLLHASAYAFLTVLAALLPFRRHYFWIMVGLLALHGVGTEIGQTYVPSRHGCIRDVLIDWGGIALGLAFLWGLSRAQSRHGFAASK